jgi:hypothetical protein
MDLGHRSFLPWPTRSGQNRGRGSERLGTPFVQYLGAAANPTWDSATRAMSAAGVPTVLPTASVLTSWKVTPCRSHDGDSADPVPGLSVFPLRVLPGGEQRDMPRLHRAQVLLEAVSEISELPCSRQTTVHRQAGWSAIDWP